MNTENFEERLRGQPLRPIPAEWREEILTAAQAAAPSRHLSPVARSTPWWFELLWPSPTAWAGLAVVWILIFAMDFSVRDKSPALAKKFSPPSPEVIVELRQQQQLLAELIGPGETRVTGPTKPFGNQPRSERRVEILMT